MALGYQAPGSDLYNPLRDASLMPEDRMHKFQVWVSGYYKHGDSAAELEPRVHLDNPIPTFLTMTANDKASALHLPPAYSGGSDTLLVQSGGRHGLFAYLREHMLYPSSAPNKWDDVELRYVWCDQSLWEMVWSAWAFREELDNAEKIGKKSRKVTIKRVPGANHFVG